MPTISRRMFLGMSSAVLLAPPVITPANPETPPSQHKEADKKQIYNFVLPANIPYSISTMTLGGYQQDLIDDLKRYRATLSFDARDLEYGADMMKCDLMLETDQLGGSRSLHGLNGTTFGLFFGKSFQEVAIDDVIRSGGNYATLYEANEYATLSPYHTISICTGKKKRGKLQLIDFLSIGKPPQIFMRGIIACVQETV